MLFNFEKETGFEHLSSRRAQKCPSFSSLVTDKKVSMVVINLTLLAQTESAFLSRSSVIVDPPGSDTPPLEVFRVKKAHVSHFYEPE